MDDTSTMHKNEENGHRPRDRHTRRDRETYIERDRET